MIFTDQDSWSRLQHLCGQYVSDYHMIWGDGSKTNGKKSRVELLKINLAIQFMFQTESAGPTIQVEVMPYTKA